MGQKRALGSCRSCFGFDRYAAGWGHGDSPSKWLLSRLHPCDVGCHLHAVTRWLNLRGGDQVCRQHPQRVRNFVRSCFDLFIVGNVLRLCAHNKVPLRGGYGELCDSYVHSTRSFNYLITMCLVVRAVYDFMLSISNNLPTTKDKYSFIVSHTSGRHEEHKYVSMIQCVYISYLLSPVLGYLSLGYRVTSTSHECFHLSCGLLLSLLSRSTPIQVHFQSSTMLVAIHTQRWLE